MSDYKILDRKLLFEHAQVRIVRETLEHRGRRVPYFYLESPVDAVATVAVDSSNRLLLTRQYRHPVRQVIYDLPAGRLEPGEDPLAGAMREFEEETGYYPNHFVPLGYYNQFPGTLRVGTNLYFARDLTPTGQKLDEGEELEMVRLPVAEVLEMILRGDVIDGSLQLGVLLAIHKGWLQP